MAGTASAATAEQILLRVEAAAALQRPSAAGDHRWGQAGRCCLWGNNQPGEPAHKAGPPAAGLPHTRLGRDPAPAPARSSRCNMVLLGGQPLWKI